MKALAEWSDADRDRIGTATAAEWLAAWPVLRGSGVTLHLDVTVSDLPRGKAWCTLDGWTLDDPDRRGSAVTGLSLVDILRAEREVLAQRGAA